MLDAYVCDFLRTPIGKYAGALAQVRADDLAAIPIRELIRRQPRLQAELDEVMFGCANQAGEDNRNVARMSALLAGLSESVAAVTLNRLCASGLDAVSAAARAVHSGEVNVVIAGGVESMTRAPFVMGKADHAFQRSAELADTTIGWRFVNPAMRQRYGVDSMVETAENVATQFNISRDDQDEFALRSQQRAAAAQKLGIWAPDIVPVQLKDTLFSLDEQPRANSTREGLAKLKPLVSSAGTVTAGNSSSINDGAAAMIIANELAAKRFGLVPRARVLGIASAGVEPRIMGIGPVAAVTKLLQRLNMKIGQFDFIELNEAFASQALASLRGLGLPDDAAHVNPHGGAIALGHPLGMSGARLVGAVTRHLHESGGKYGLATMCVGVGQGVAIALERV